MNSTDLYRLSKSPSLNSIGMLSLTVLAITFLCLTILSLLTHGTSSQPLMASPRRNDQIDNALWIRPAFDSESNEMSIVDDESGERIQALAKSLLVQAASGRVQQPNSSEPVRRANFWKRANFWRKRANFW